MGTTTGGHPLPYPDGSDLVIDGDDAIEALAKAVTASPGAATFIATASGVVVTASLTPILWGAIATEAADWTYDAVTGALAWFGPDRWVLVSTALTLQTVSGSTYSASTYILHNGATVASTSLVLPGVAPPAQFSHNLSMPVFLATGDAITISATAGGSTTAAGKCRVIGL